MSNVWMIDTVDQLAPKEPVINEPAEGPGSYAIIGRVLSQTGEDLPCRVIKMSTSHAAVVGARRIEAGEAIVVYLENIGILRGHVLRPLADGFIMQFDLSEARKPTIRAALEWHAERAGEAADKRTAPRIVPVAKAVEVRLGEQIVLRGMILNVSISGAAIIMRSAERPFQGALVRVGRKTAKVVRLLEKGIAVHFDEPLDPLAFDETVVL